jgi:flagellar biosynthesis/type III secretory pathway protein FliH
MILRDAIVSDQRCTLPFNRAPHSQEQVFDVLPAAAPFLPAPAVRAETEVSLERIESWLAVQDAETRCACASFLIDDIAELRQSAQAEGFASGLQEGRKEAERESHQWLALLQDIITTAEEAFRREQEKLAALCVDVVGEVFAKLAGVALSTPQATAATVAEVMKKVREGRELTVRVNSRDLPVLQAQEMTLRAAVPGRTIALAADSRVELGGCIVETNLGSLDGRLEVQMRGLYETLKAAKTAMAERT